jgi:C4-dicarboxylate-specific signal transduction histidine kinase
VLANRIHLQQVLVNLMINGLESMTAVHHQQVLTITAETSSDHFVEIAVADNGMGIAPEQLDKLFSQFHTTKPNGLGLGLIISKTLIEGQGGQISAENMAAGGAKFRIRLPVAETVQEQPSSLVSV